MLIRLLTLAAALLLACASTHASAYARVSPHLSAPLIELAHESKSAHREFAADPAPASSENGRSSHCRTGENWRPPLSLASSDCNPTVYVDPTGRCGAIPGDMSECALLYAAATGDSSLIPVQAEASSQASERGSGLLFGMASDAIHGALALAQMASDAIGAPFETLTGDYRFGYAQRNEARVQALGNGLGAFTRNVREAPYEATIGAARASLVDTIERSNDLAAQGRHFESGQALSGPASTVAGFAAAGRMIASRVAVAEGRVAVTIAEGADATQAARLERVMALNPDNDFGLTRPDRPELLPLKRNSVRKLLQQRGLDAQSAHNVVESFSGQIYARYGDEGERLLLTESSPNSASGVFATNESVASTPQVRQQVLALPPSNTATVESIVELQRRQLLLEGHVAPQFEWGENRAGGAWQVVTDGGKRNGAVRQINDQQP